MLRWQGACAAYDKGAYDKGAYDKGRQPWSWQAPGVRGMI